MNHTAILCHNELNMDYTYPNIFLWDNNTVSVGYYPSDPNSKYFNSENSRIIIEDMSQKNLVALILNWERNNNTDYPLM